MKGEKPQMTNKTFALILLAVTTLVGFTAWIEGRTSASEWEFEDGLVVSNKPYTSRSWSAVGFSRPSISLRQR